MTELMIVSGVAAAYFALLTYSATLFAAAARPAELVAMAAARVRRPYTPKS